MTPDALCDKVLKVFPDAKIIDSGDRWATWPKDSYMWVIFRLDRATREAYVPKKIRAQRPRRHGCIG